jgi:hypothetical protein
MSIRIITVGPRLLGYKGTTFESWIPELTKNSENTEEWSGFYVATTVSTARDYVEVPENGKGTGYLYDVHTFKPMKFLEIDDAFLADISIPQKEKAERIKATLRSLKLPDLDKAEWKNPLIPELGRHGLCYRGFLTADEMEIIIPKNLVDGLTLIQKTILTYDRHLLKSERKSPYS